MPVFNKNNFFQVLVIQSVAKKRVRIAILYS
jgi:hypothetical protein